MDFIITDNKKHAYAEKLVTDNISICLCVTNLYITQRTIFNSNYFYSTTSIYQNKGQQIESGEANFFVAVCFRKIGN